MVPFRLRAKSRSMSPFSLWLPTPHAKNKRADQMVRPFLAPRGGLEPPTKRLTVVKHSREDRLQGRRPFVSILKIVVNETHVILHHAQRAMPQEAFQGQGIAAVPQKLRGEEMT